jgi:lipopolysaccharide export LptBFGC system permease protein LptF
MIGHVHKYVAYPLFVLGMILIGLVTFLVIKKGEKMWMDS